MNEERLARIMATWNLTRGHILLVTLFQREHPEQSFPRALATFLRGEGPAAVAAGRAGVRVLWSVRPAWLAQASMPIDDHAVAVAVAGSASIAA